LDSINDPKAGDPKLGDPKSGSLPPGPQVGGPQVNGPQATGPHLLGPPEEMPEPQPAPPSALDVRLMAVMAAARFHGAELDREDLRFPSGEAPAPAMLVEWVRQSGLWVRATRMRWRNLVNLQSAGPVVLLLADGSAALMIKADPARNIVWLKSPSNTFDNEGVAVDELRLAQVWTGETMLIRATRGSGQDNEPFSALWIARMVWLEKLILRDIVIGSVVLSVLTILPPMLTMVVIDRVITYQSYSTLTVVVLMIATAALFETYLGFCRRTLILTVATRLDAKLALHVFKRLLSLPIDFFERNQSGAITYQIGQITKIRDFLTGKLLSTLLDCVTLLVLVPFLFWLNPILTWVVLGCALLITLVIFVFLKPIRIVHGKWVASEVAKSVVLGESIHGIRTVKSLALEPQQRELWDRRTADAAGWRMELGRVSNWPQTLVTPLEAMITRGVLMLGAYFALTGGGVSVGSLLAFMMLSGRVGQPLVSMAKLMEDLEDVRSAVGLAANVLNNRPESSAPGAGLRPKFEGAVAFNKVDFAYPGSKNKALNDISFAIPAGTMLGVVGRSGSGKSTVTRLLQGINREYEGSIKVDGSDLREINLAHLRRSFGVVLQENFLFRGTVKDNIIAGRPGLTLTDAVRAARLAGAEEFIERMPAGYETWIEEGSPNLSGGQRQRLAIARALIHDPRILILDEATSALDPESEALVNANIARIAHGRTMVIVSHRLSSLTDCHQILVLDNGRFVDMAPHRDLLERCAIYRQLWQQQNRHMQGEKSATPKPILAQGD
jgi:HlyB family type I secretion system ABC transporter